MSTHTFFSLCVPSPVATVKVPLSQPCFDHFLGPVLGAMMKQVCWHWGAPRLTEACPRHEDKARLTGTRIYIILLLGSLSNDWWCGSGTLWCLLDLQKYCCLSKLRQFWQKKVTAESHFRTCKTLALDSKKWSSPIPNFDPLASCEDLFVWKFGERMYSVLNHLEPTWTSLNLSWNNVCAGEQLGNHFKFVGTDLWTREPIGTYRNQVGTNLEPNGTSLCMEELGDGFSFVFVVCGVSGCCLTHVLGTWCCDCIG